MAITTAARLTKHGKPLQLQQVDLPEPGPDEVLVEMDFAGVNPIDRYNAIGTVAPGTPLPRTLGVEGVGRLADGTRVLVNGEGLGAARDGTWAGLCIAPRSAVIEVPDNVESTVAASIAVAGLTAWGAVALLAEVTAEDTVLVLGAGGGVGLAVVSLAHSRGARVIGQVGTESKVEAVHFAGADTVVVVDAAGLAKLEDTPTVVADPLGGGFTAAAMGLVQERGRYVVYGTSAGAEISLNWQQVYRKGLTIHGLANLFYSPGERSRHLQDTLAAAGRGELTVPVDRVLPLARVNEAFEALTDRSVIGKVVLDLHAG